MIPFLDLRREYLDIKKDINLAIQRVLDSSWFLFGQELERLEISFANYIGTKYAIGVASGTDALCLSLLALGLKPGDEVITVANTAMPTISAISQAGGVPVFVDVNQEDLLIDVDKIQSKISPKSKIILPVHLYGQFVNMKEIKKIARDNGLKIIEDACQAHKEKIGTSDVSCFSFYPTKNLGACGDAGMIATNNKKIHDQVKLLRNYGKKDDYIIKGMNSRLDEIQAAILRVKLKKLNAYNQKRKNIATLYQKAFLSLKNIKVITQNSNFHLFVIRSKKRDQLKDYLAKNNIATMIHYPINAHKTRAYNQAISLPVSERAVKEILSLPCYPYLKLEEQKKIIQRIQEWDVKN